MIFYIFPLFDSKNRILFLAKPDDQLMSNLFEAIQYLWEKEVEIVLEEIIFRRLYSYQPFFDWIEQHQPSSATLSSSSQTSSSISSNLSQRITLLTSQHRDVDLIVTFGGDGLLLHCNRLYNSMAMPPVMCFDFGSLGFLTPFQYQDFREEVGRNYF
jgi:NAD kinase